MGYLNLIEVLFMVVYHQILHGNITSRLVFTIMHFSDKSRWIMGFFFLVKTYGMGKT